MEYTDLRAQLVIEAARLRAAHLAGGPQARVPACPEWSATDLLDHVTEVYDHKIQSMRLLRQPGADESIERSGGAVERFDAALAEMLAVFDDRGPDSLAYTWYGPDQTCGFWMRRMVHETAIHRVDAEQAAGVPPAAFGPGVAVDGIGELLTVMIDWGSRAKRQLVAEALAAEAGLRVGIRAEEAVWTVAVAPDGVTATPGTAAAPAVVVGDAGTMYLWLWRRLATDAVTVEGDPAGAERLHALVEQFTR